MPTKTGALSGIIDIETPVAPPAMESTIIVAIAALLLLATAAHFLRRHYSSPRVRARRNLRALQRRHDQQQLDSRRAVFELAAILREAFSVSKLSATSSLPSFRRMPESNLLKPLDSGIRRNDESVKLRWSEFMDELSTARYAAHDIDPAQLDELFRAAREWLRYKP